MKVRIKKLSDKAVVPTKAHSTDAGFDLVATKRWFDEHGNICYGTDLSFEIPEGFVGYIFPRSSNSKKDLMLSNSVGVIDSGYRGEVTFKFRPIHSFYRDDIRTDEGNDWMDSYVGYVPNEEDEGLILTGCRIYKVGDRIGQLIIMPIPDIEFEEADELTETDRGTGGYGSSGR